MEALLSGASKKLSQRFNINEADVYETLTQHFWGTSHVAPEQKNTHQPPQTTPQTTSQTSVILVKDYKKSIVVVGDTKPYKDALTSGGYKYNSSLFAERRLPGWVCGTQDANNINKVVNFFSKLGVTLQIMTGDEYLASLSTQDKSAVVSVTEEYDSDSSTIIPNGKLQMEPPAKKAPVKEESSESEEEPAKKAPAKKAPAKEESSESEEEPVKPKKAPAKKAPAKEESSESEEEPVKPKKAPAKKAPAKEESSESEEEPVKPKKAPAKKAPSKEESSESEEEPVNKAPAKKAPVKEESSESEEEPPKKPAKKAPAKEDSSESEEEPPKKPAKKAPAKESESTPSVQSFLSKRGVKCVCDSSVSKMTICKNAHGNLWNEETRVVFNKVVLADKTKSAMAVGVQHPDGTVDPMPVGVLKFLKSKGKLVDEKQVE